MTVPLTTWLKRMASSSVVLVLEEIWPCAIASWMAKLLGAKIVKEGEVDRSDGRPGGRMDERVERLAAKGWDGLEMASEKEGGSSRTEDTV